MDWGMFDGDLFESAHKIAGVWVVRIKGQRVEIQIAVDANGRYFYRNSHWFKSQQKQRHLAPGRAFASLEQALLQAVKDLKTPFASGRSSGRWVPAE